MRVAYFIILLFFITTVSCGEKSYEDYGEDDFYEVQGIVVNSYRTSTVFDSPQNKSVQYKYHFDKDYPLDGFESGISDVRTSVGAPIAVLVLKSNPEISFFWYGGVINHDDLNIGYQFLIHNQEFRKRAGIE